MFVFISGFFFHFIFYKNFNFFSFIKKKSLNVFLPYLILSIAFLFLKYLVKHEIPFPFTLSGNTTEDDILSFFTNLVTGRSLTAYWYIPFIMLIFYASPLFIAFIKIPIVSQVLITLILFIVSMFIHRPFLNINVFHSILYFLPFYQLGILYSEKKEIIDSKITKRSVLFILAGLVVLSALTMSILGQSGNLHNDIVWKWTGLDYMIIHKIFLIGFMLSLTKQLEKYNLPSLKKVAQISFPIFFVHSWVLSFIHQLDIFNLYKNINSFWEVTLLFILVFSSSFTAAIITKRILKERSLYIIGW